MPDAFLVINLLVINAGSSSLKFSFYEGDTRLLSGQFDGIGARPSASATGARDEKVAPPDISGTTLGTPSDALPAVIPWARQYFGTRPLSALGHRVVHRGLRHSHPALVTPELLDELEALVPLAPLHEPHNLAPIRMAAKLNPDLPQIACFDTAFHRTVPELNQAFALPFALYDEGVRRYFEWHGRDTARPPRGGCPSWQWLLGLRPQGGSIGRDDDGVHRA